jgi:type III secretion system FlhB-like substrate exporter
MNRPESPGDAPRAEAVALAYNAGQSAPTVVAKGRGLIAAEIISRAKEAGVFVHESPELVALLMQVDLDARIPPELYGRIPLLPKRRRPRKPGPSALKTGQDAQLCGT